MTPQTNPSSLAKALASGVTTAGAFFDDEAYLDYVDNLQKQWQENQPKPMRSKEWVEMYPEIKETFDRLLLEKEIELENLTKEVKQRLKNALSIKLGDWSLVLIEKIRATEGERIKKLKKEILWLRLGLIVVDVKQNNLTEDQIQQARDFPVEDLINTKKINKMWCCPFHEEKTPSFHIYKENSWHCFGCQAHGQNAIDFVMKKNKLEFVDAVKFLIGK